jgi:hypothetical protein
MGNRQTYIDEYLKEVEGTLTILTSKYDQNDLKRMATLDIAKISNCVINLRTCLDYIYKDIIDRILIPSNASIPDNKVTRELAGKIYFPYGKTNQTDFDRSAIIGRLKIDNPKIYEMVESCQLYKYEGALIHDLCGYANDIKHDDPSQVKQDIKKIVIGNYIPTIEGSAIKITNGQGIQLMGQAVPKIEIVNSNNISVFACSFDCITSVNSTVKIIRCTIQSKNQEETVTINYNEFSSVPNSTSSINGILQPSIRDSYKIALVNETEFTRKDTGTNILVLIHRAMMKIKSLSSEIYKVLP